MNKAVVLLSGGLDSATALALAVRHGFDCYALSVNYGQRHRAELAAATRVAAVLGRKSASRDRVEPPVLRRIGADRSASGVCDACRIRREGFAAAGIDDPTRYLQRV